MVKSISFKVVNDKVKTNYSNIALYEIERYYHNFLNASLRSVEDSLAIFLSNKIKQH